jgi:hypothetical protein
MLARSRCTTNVLPASMTIRERSQCGLHLVIDPAFCCLALQPAAWAVLLEASSYVRG